MRDIFSMPPQLYIPIIILVFTCISMYFCYRSLKGSKMSREDRKDELRCCLYEQKLGGIDFFNMIGFSLEDEQFINSILEEEVEDERY